MEWIGSVGTGNGFASSRWTMPPVRKTKATTYDASTDYSLLSVLCLAVLYKSYKGVWGGFCL